MRIHPNPSHSDYVSYIKRDVLFPQILPNDSIIVNVEIDVAVETVTTTLEEMLTVSLLNLAGNFLMPYCNVRFCFVHVLSPFSYFLFTEWFVGEGEGWKHLTI